MSEAKKFEELHTDPSIPQPKEIVGNTKLTTEQYDQMYLDSIQDPETFWAEHGKRLDWIKPYSKVKDVDFKEGKIRWYEDGTLNASYNCIDRHLPKRADQVALIHEGDEPGDVTQVTYAELKDKVSQLANALKARGVKKGDRVIIYMPMVLEASYAMLACARIGAIHSVVFGGFSPKALQDRVQDCEATVVITADEGMRAGKKIPLKANTDEALKECPEVHTVLVYQRTSDDIAWNEKRDVWYHELCEAQSTECEPEEMSAEDPLFILYTSGSTGKPKGVLHTTGGYMVYAAMTHEYVFDYRDGDVYWCTADVGWITGHTYMVYGPLANGAISLLFESTPNYPDAGRLWDIVQRHKVNILYTAPTAIRALIREGDAYVTKYDRSSLRVLGSVGEPINEEAWHWYYDVVGEKHCPIVDTWWQTETGGILITPLPGVHDLKPSHASFPFFGVNVVILDHEGKEKQGPAIGNLAFKDSWPGQMRGVYKNHQRFMETYFAQAPGYYFAGDGVRRDEDGYYRITGRVDDVLNVSGHRIGTAEVESALNAHPQVAESAVVGFPHEVKGEGIYAFVIVKDGAEESDTLYQELKQEVRSHIGPIATPDIILVTPALPKTRSGKIMRRILRKIAADKFDELGDTSTLADPSVVEGIIEKHKKVK